MTKRTKANLNYGVHVSGGELYVQLVEFSKSLVF